MKRILLCVVLILVGGVASADNGRERVVKLIKLHYKEAHDVIPLLKPALAEGAKVSGQGKELVINTTLNNFTTIRYLIQKIDVPPVEFIITIRQGNATGNTTNLSNVIEYNTHSNDYQKREQQVRVLSGEMAFVSAGRDEPQIVSVGGGNWNLVGGGSNSIVGSLKGSGLLPGSGSLTGSGSWNLKGNGSGGYVDYDRRMISQGFWVTPKLQGSRVKLTIYRLREKSNRMNSQAIQYQKMASTVRIPLNRWTPLGATRRTGFENAPDAVVYQTGGRFRQTSDLFIKVSIVEDTRALSPTK